VKGFGKGRLKAFAKRNLLPIVDVALALAVLFAAKYVFAGMDAGPLLAGRMVGLLGAFSKFALPFLTLFLAVLLFIDFYKKY